MDFASLNEIAEALLIGVAQFCDGSDYRGPVELVNLATTCKILANTHKSLSCSRSTERFLDYTNVFVYGALRLKHGVHMLGDSSCEPDKQIVRRTYHFGCKIAKKLVYRSTDRIFRIISKAPVYSAAHVTNSDITCFSELRDAIVKYKTAEPSRVCVGVSVDEALTRQGTESFTYCKALKRPGEYLPIFIPHYTPTPSEITLFEAIVSLIKSI